MQSEAHVPWFRVVFEMTDGSLMEFQMQQGDFRELEKRRSRYADLSGKSVYMLPKI